MKEVFEHISHDHYSSFIYRCLDLPRFSGCYHYHPELELTHIESSTGKRFVGSNISEYSAGDLVLIGSNVPHCWKSSEPPAPDDHYAKAKVIQFGSNFSGAQSTMIPELMFLKSLFRKANAGLFIYGKTRTDILEKLHFDDAEHALKKYVRLLEILYLIANSTETELIDDHFSCLDFTGKESDRFNTVYSYILENFTKDIHLGILAELANLTPTSFCRYFKQVTHKTPVAVIMELRIKNACHLLKNSEKSIADVCFESGFGNHSHFNKVFRKSTGQTPIQFRQLNQFANF